MRLRRRGPLPPRAPYTADELASTYGFSGLYGAERPRRRARRWRSSSSNLTSGATSPPTSLATGLRPTCATSRSTPAPARAREAARLPSTSRTSSASRQGQRSTSTRGPNNNVGPLDVYSAIVNQDLAKVISTSWGICEAQDGGRARGLGRGQPLRAGGGTGPDGRGRGRRRRLDRLHGQERRTPLNVPAVDDPGSQPYVTSVGGTSITARGPATDRDCLERRRQRRRRRRHLVELGDARLPVGRRRRACTW